MSKDSVRINDMSFSYGTLNIYDRLDFSIDYNIFGLIGINGSGKSTLLKLMTGLLHPDEGSIIVNGYNVKKEKMKILQTIGVLHENPKFPAWAYVNSYLIWVGQIRGLTELQSKQQSHLLIYQMMI